MAFPVADLNEFYMMYVQSYKVQGALLYSVREAFTAGRNSILQCK